MSNDVYVSTNSFSDRRPDAILRAIEGLPDAGIELSAVEADEADCVALCRSLHREGRHVVLHNYFPNPDQPFVLNLAAQDSALRRHNVDFCRRALDLSAEVGAPLYAVHPGFAVDFSPSDLGNPARQAQLARNGAIAGFEEFAAHAIDSLLELDAHGRSVGVTVLAENNVVSPDSGPQGSGMIPMARPEELIRLTDAGIGLLFDVAHARVSATTFQQQPEAWFEELRPHIAALHLSDNDGVTDCGDGFTDDAWFACAVSTSAELPVTLELNRKTETEIRQHLATIQRWRS